MLTGSFSRSFTFGTAGLQSKTTFSGIAVNTIPITVSANTDILVGIVVSNIPITVSTAADILIGTVVNTIPITTSAI